MTRTAAYIIAVALIAGCAAPAYAAIPSQIAPDIGTVPTNQQFQLLSPNTYVFMGNNLYSNSWFIFSDHVNFTANSFANSGKPVSDFGIGTSSGNATISNIDGSGVTLTMQCVNAATCYATYYFRSTEPVQSVAFTGATTSTISSQNFLLSSAAFNAASAPAVLYNSTGGWAEAKITYQNPSTIKFNAGTFVLADLGSAKTFLDLRISKPSATNLPASINIYSSNDAITWTLQLSNVTVTQNTSNQTLTFNSPVTARYFKAEVSVPGSASTVQISEIHADVQSSTVVVTVTNTSANSAANTIYSNMYMMVSIASFGFIAIIVAQFAYQKWWETRA